MKKEFGATACRDLIGCDLGTEKDRQCLKDNDFRHKCTELTKSANLIALTLIQND